MNCTCAGDQPVESMTIPELVREFKNLHVHFAAHADRFEPGMHNRLDAVVEELRRHRVLD